MAGSLRKERIRGILMQPVRAGASHAGAAPLGKVARDAYTKEFSAQGRPPTGLDAFTSQVPMSDRRQMCLGCCCGSVRKSNAAATKYGCVLSIHGEL